MNSNDLKRKLLEKKKSLYAILLTGTLALPLVGCAKSSLLAGTILEDTCVMEINGEWRIVRSVYPVEGGVHIHYEDIESGLIFVLDDSKDMCNEKNFVLDSMPPVKNLSLTSEELKKAMDKELTDEDIVKIIARINGENKENDDNLSR